MLLRADSEWFVHEAGWHLGDGAMTGWPFRNSPEVPDQPYGLMCGEPCFFPIFQGVECGSFDRGCGADPGPFIPHPALWDLHVFVDTVGNGGPKVAKLTSDVGLPNPCGGEEGLGTSSRNSPGSMDPFPDF